MNPLERNSTLPEYGDLTAKTEPHPMLAKTPRTTLTERPYEPPYGNLVFHIGAEVRCRNCRHRRPYADDGHAFWCEPIGGNELPPDFGCVQFERKDGES